MDITLSLSLVFIVHSFITNVFGTRIIGQEQEKLERYLKCKDDGQQLICRWKECPKYSVVPSACSKDLILETSKKEEHIRHLHFMLWAKGSPENFDDIDLNTTMSTNHTKENGTLHETPWGVDNFDWSPYPVPLGELEPLSKYLKCFKVPEAAGLLRCRWKECPPFSTKKENCKKDLSRVRGPGDEPFKDLFDHVYLQGEPDTMTEEDFMSEKREETEDPIWNTNEISVSTTTQRTTITWKN